MPHGRLARFGAFIEGAQMFDAAAFAIGSSEALCMDPQQRILLQHAAQALQSQGDRQSMPFGNMDLRVSVMVGIGPAEYVSQTNELLPVGLHFATGGAVSVASGRQVDQQLLVESPACIDMSACTCCAHASFINPDHDECVHVC